MCARSIKRVASAVGEGATTVHLIHEYLSGADQERQLPPAAGARSVSAGDAPNRDCSQLGRLLWRDSWVGRGGSEGEDR
jgi:hypothetical protein